jgi:hypothetical protein
VGFFYKLNQKAVFSTALCQKKSGNHDFSEENAVVEMRFFTILEPLAS